MGISIRRGTTKNFVFRIPPFIKNPDGTVDTYEDLPNDCEVGTKYKVIQAFDDYPEDSYFEFDGGSFIYIGHDRVWSEFGTVHVRLLQGSYFIDKVFEGEESDCIIATYTQDETIKLVDSKPAELQLFSVNGDLENELALKSQTFRVSITKSLWSGVIHNE